MSEYKAGDVVLHPKYGRGIVQQGFAQWVEWPTLTGAKKLDEVADDLRRLVVIDPEDREQVERLAQAYLDKFGSGNSVAAIANQMQAALREFVKPTPEPLTEPTDLAARVVDKDGDTWARIGDQWVSVVDGYRVIDTWAQMIEDYGPLRLAGGE